MRFLIPLAALAACSAPSPAPSNQVQATPSRDMPGAPAAPASPTVAALAGPPRPGELKTFKDWTVGCDNGGRCTMASLGSEMGDFPLYTMQLARAAGPAGGFEIAIDALQGDAAAPATIAVDGARFAVVPDGLAGAGAARIAAAMANGTTITLSDRTNAKLAAISLAGASAALRYIDAAQGRVGTVTATVARGAVPVNGVPAAPALPVIAAPPIDGAAATPNASQLVDMRRIGECEERMADASIWRVKTAAVGGGATIVLLPCSAGAYNEIDALFVIRDGKVAPADVDAPSGFEETGADSQTPVRSAINGAIERGIVSSHPKGRGLGDCGVSQRFAWDGRQLRLIEQSAMGECRGKPHYITTWRASVERR